MAFVGPATSLLIGALSWLAAKAVGTSVPLLSATLSYLAVANLLLGLFNLIPAFPLDGGRVLRSIVWKVTNSLQTAMRERPLRGTSSRLSLSWSVSGWQFKVNVSTVSGWSSLACFCSRQVAQKELKVGDKTHTAQPDPESSKSDRAYHQERQVERL